MTENTSPLHITFVTLFPEAIETMMGVSILGRAQQHGHIVLHTVQIRNHAFDKHKMVDDTPCGGGAGQVMKVDVLHRAIQAAQQNTPQDGEAKIILLDPAGRPFQQEAAISLAQADHLIFLCGRYEGVDARIWNYIDEAWSLGDFVITGGELAGLVMADAIGRMRPGVLGNADSIQTESHMGQGLEHHQYTRPIEYDNWHVPDVLLGGHHQKIAQARQEDASARTQRLRPDLVKNPEAPQAHECLAPVRKGTT